MSAPKQKCPNCGERTYGTHRFDDCIAALQEDRDSLRAQLAEAEAKALEYANAHFTLMNEHRDAILRAESAEARLARLRPVVEDLEDYFAERADADCVGDPPRYVGNKAMTFLTRIRMALGSEQEGRSDG